MQKEIVFLYSGQGSQYVGMAKDLYQNWPWFKKSLDDLFCLSPTHLETPLDEVMLGAHDAGPLLAETQYTQPILYALEILLTRTWARWGIVPNAVIGHSLGEFSAAAVAGVFSEEDGMRLVSERGRLMQHLPIRGKYAVVFGDASEVIEIVHPLKPSVVVGGSNGPNITVVSGEEGAVDQVLETCVERGMSTRTLNVNLPFHSPLMSPMLAEYETYCMQFRFESPKIPWFSTLTGQRLMSLEDCHYAHWRSQIVEPVRFWAGMMALTDNHRRIMVEIGPGKTLLTLGQQAMLEGDHLWIASLEPKTAGRDALIQAALRLEEAGIALNKDQLNSDLDVF